MKLKDKFGNSIEVIDNYARNLIATIQNSITELTNIISTKQDVLTNEDKQNIADLHIDPVIPSKISELENDSGYLTEVTMTYERTTNTLTEEISEYDIDNVSNCNDVYVFIDLPAVSASGSVSVGNQYGRYYYSTGFGNTGSVSYYTFHFKRLIDGNFVFELNSNKANDAAVPVTLATTRTTTSILPTMFKISFTFPVGTVFNVYKR